ncbi:Ger(x)C family spore germination C-terminal domain-containing protein [Paenibacillus maysiensis]|uniref:Ger(x)C family spore germination C-terminal domain-containing protein n=1 Tax=Paenibacillus maysiensis TaxID=1155954 RepID=UPI00047028DC|nr:Ger(x)C family spore germination C-terminal domain-containing protein [Paenibacillus maysiensis]
MEPDRKTFQWSHTTPKGNNHKDVSYPTSDIGSSYDTDISFSVGVYDGLTQSTLTNKKDFIDENTPAVFYNISIVTTFSYGGKTYTHTTDYTYDEPRRWTSPSATKVTKEESGNTNKYVVNTSQTYNDYGSITSAVDVLGVTTAWSERGPTLHTLIKLNVLITESPEGKSNAIIEQDLQEKLEHQFNQTATKIHSYGSDILGVDMIYRPYLSEKQVKRWKTTWFPKIPMRAPYTCFARFI